MSDEDAPKDLQSRTLRLVQQFLHESGFSGALASLESESGVTYQEDEAGLGGELLALVQEHEEFVSAAGTDAIHDDADLLERGDGCYASKEVRTLSGVHAGNVVTVRLQQATGLLATAGSDKTVAVLDTATGAVSARFVLPSSAISLDWCAARPGVLLASTLGGTVHVLSAADSSEVVSFAGHRKFCVAARWIRSGAAMVTASHDRTVTIFRRKQAAEGAEGEEYEAEHQWSFTGPVECLALSAEGDRAVVGVRDDNYLHVLGLEAPHAEQLINMNATGDDHVSFTALDVSFSPSGKYLLVSTDKDRLIMYSVEGGKQVRNFYGVSNDEYSNPHHVWHPSGKYIFSTSQDNRVHVLEVATQKRVSALAGHKKVVRSIDLDVSTGMLVTGSYDSTIKFWSA
eukprot:m51a1_g4079 hypothetical protein (400) ;mRNA; r:17732-19264